MWDHMVEHQMGLRRDTGSGSFLAGAYVNTIGSRNKNLLRVL